MLKQKLAGLRGFTYKEIALFPLIVLLLGCSRIAILSVPMRRYGALLGSRQNLLCVTPLVTARQRYRAKRLGKVIEAIAELTPWESKCLVQAMTARVMLGMLGIPYGFFFGVAKDPDSVGGNSLKAHAWVVSGSAYVTGGYSWQQFSVVMSYYDRGWVSGALPEK